MPESQTDQDRIPSGEKLGARYEVDHLIGRGTLFDVYRARDIEDGQWVALKVLKPALSVNLAFCNELEKRARAVQSLVHPNIVRILDVFRARHSVCIVTEYVAGMTLAERIERTSPMPVDAVLEIGARVSDALAFAHENGMAHGDLRPQNILLGGDGRIKISDFGLTHAVSVTTESQMQSVLHWVQCMAPEVCEGGEPTPASDVYSLGCVLYWMLTGTPPFPGDNAIVVALKHAKETARPIERTNPASPSALNDIVTMSLGKEPKDRPENGRAVQRMLSRIHRPRTISEEPAPGVVVPEAPLRSAPPPSQVREEVGGVPRFLIWIRNLLLMALGVGVVLSGVLLYRIFQPVKDVQTPSLVGLSEEQAIQMLTDMQLRGASRIRESSRPTGEVLSQSPESGTMVKPGRVITLYVSRGPRMVSVPNVTEMSLDRARELATQANLTVKKTSDRWSETVQEDYVIEQEPSEGEQVKPGSTIRVVVSKGPEPLPPEPEPTWSLGPYTGADAGSIPSTPPELRTARARRFNMTIDIPSKGIEEPVQLLIVVGDENGENIVTDEQRKLGEKVIKRIDAVGEKVKVRVYLNGVLFSEGVR